MRSSHARPCHVAVIHPDRACGQSLADELAGLGFCASLYCSDEALRDLSAGARPQLAVVAVGRLNDDGDGLDLLRDVVRISPSSQIVALMPPGAALATCCEAVSLGVASIVEADGPPPYPSLPERVQQAWERYQALQGEGEAIDSGRIFDEIGFAGRSRAMAELLARAKRVAAVSDVPVLIAGESGTGKQLLAEAIHRLDPKRCRRPFLTVNCAAITGTLAESTLFGHKRGAFTGATEERLGHFRAADGGTILLDEVGELSAELQPKLLRVLQEGRVMPVGSDEEVPVDVRIISATNSPLEALVEQKRFRLDLYQRLNVIELRMPPLRQRKEDIPVLFQHFLSKYGSYYPGDIAAVDPRVYEVIGRSLGKGNVRELENLARRVLSLKHAGDRIELGDLPSQLLAPARPGGNGRDLEALLAPVVEKLVGEGDVSLQQLTDEIERLVLARVLRQRGRTHADMARVLGFTRRTFYNKLRRHNLASKTPPPRPASV